MQFIIGPILVWRSLKVPENYKFNILNSEEFLEERTPTFTQLHEKILNNNYKYIGSSTILEDKSSVYFSVYNNNDKKLACTLATATGAPVSTTQIEFTQIFTDGSLLCVSNSETVSPYPNHAFKLTYRYPKINDFNSLSEITDKLIFNNKGSKTKKSLTSNSEFIEIERYLNLELKDNIDKGFISTNIYNGIRRLTIKGAILMTWKMVWPIKQVLNFKEILYSKRALKNA